MPVSSDRWRLLKSAIIKSARNEELATPTTSTRFHADRDMFEKSSVETTSTRPDTRVRRYTHGDTSFLVSEMIPKVDLRNAYDAFSGFLHTGNVCIWPSEEFMAFHLLENAKRFDGTSILELGAGMAGLAGMTLAAASNAKSILVTEGNPECVANLQATVELNSFKSSNVSAKQLLWSEDFEWDGPKYDFVLLADCLYERSLHSSLLAVFSATLAPGGEVLIMAPSRKGTVESFADLVRSQGWSADIQERYNEELWRRHMLLTSSDTYIPDIHYPLLLTLKK